MNLTLADLLPLLPLLLVTGTVVAAMVMVGLRRHYGLNFAITVTGLLLAAIAAALLLPSVSRQVTPLLLIDQYSLFFTVVICCGALGIALLSYSYLYHLADQREEYYLLLGIATIGAVVLVSSNHFVSTVLGLETLGMSLYGMIAYPVHGQQQAARWPLEAAVKYLVLSAAASGFILFGMALVYAQTGTLVFSSLVAPSHGATPGAGAGFATVALLLILAGMAFKLSLVPFHLWTPDVYQGAPLPVTACLATIGKAGVLVVLLRFLVASEALQFAGLMPVLALLAIASMLVGNLLALQQENIKRLLAYSSIAHMGYLLIAILAGFRLQGSISIEAVTFYLLAYMIMSLGAFGVAALVSCSEQERDHIDHYQGLFWRSPGLALVFTAMLLSLAGIPLTVGFIGKFYLVFAGVQTGLWLLLAALIIGSGIGLYYYLRIVYRMLLPAEAAVTAAGTGNGTASYGAGAVLAALLLLLLWLGVYPAPVMQLIEVVAAAIQPGG